MVPWDEEIIDALSAREAVLLNEVLRIEEDLFRFKALSCVVERESYELLLDQLNLVMARLSPEDEYIWSEIGRVVEWLRDQTLARSQAVDFSFSHLIGLAERNKGDRLSVDEYETLRELASEMADLDRQLAE